jgi:hypothetical protein
MTKTIKMKQDDRKPDLTAKLVNDAGTAYDLSGCTVKFFMKDSQGTIKINGTSASIVNAATGQVKYEWATGDTDTPGTFYGLFQVVYSAGIVMSAPAQNFIEIIIEKKIA